MIRRVLTGAAVIAFATLPSLAFAQNANPYTQASKAQWEMIKGNITKTAEKVPENLYSFKPTPEVRSLGAILAHVADSNFAICAAAAGEKPPQSGFEKNATTKAAIQKALADSNAYCDKVIAGLDDKKGAEIAQFIGPTPKLFIVAFNTSHCNEHYGNLVTYMRLKGIVPPSSAQGGM